MLAELRKYHWDGVMMDDTLTCLSHPTVGDRVVRSPLTRRCTTPPSPSLDHVAGRIKQAGFMAVPNVTVRWNTWRAVMEDWTHYVSGWENECLRQVGPGPQRRPVRRRGLAVEDGDVGGLADRNVPLLAITYSNRDDLAIQTYHRATWLLTWNSPDRRQHLRPPTRPTSTTGPRAPRSRSAPDRDPARRREHRGLAAQLHRRHHAGEPDHAGSSIDVGPGYYRLNGRRVTSVNVPALSGVILRRS